jgi:putative membrane protein
MTSAPEDRPTATSDADQVPEDPGLAVPVVTSARPKPSGAVVPWTRTSAAWLGIWAGVVVLVLLIIFMAQNTGRVEITFLWLHGTIPLALALLIAGVGVAIIAMAIATARITQLRRLLQRRGRRR